MNPIGFQDIETIYFPKHFIDDIYQKMQITGAEGYERLALCAGTRNGMEFHINRIVYPEQTLHKTPSGVSFHVSGEELERLGDWLYEKQVSLIAQIHSHPNEAYHSKTDDDYAIITRAGGLSIVIPDFGTSDIDFKNSAFYRLYPDTGWTELSPEQIATLIKIIP